MIIKTIFIKITLYFLIFVMLKSCGIYRPTDAREFPPEPEKRVQKNLKEGRGFTIAGGNKKNSGVFDFATSNELWRSSLDILDFMPLSSADYGGGLIITEWYNENGETDDLIKISVRFLSNEIRADALKITVFSKKCDANVNCKVLQSNPKIEEELQVAILRKAAKYKKDRLSGVKERDLNSIKTGDDRQ